MNEVIKTWVDAEMRKTFADLKTVVRESPEDSQVICVYVYAVPRDRVRVVDDFIFELNDSIPGAGGVLLLPMVKNVETTQKYYPEHIPVITAQKAATVWLEEYLDCVSSGRQERGWVAYNALSSSFIGLGPVETATNPLYSFAACRPANSEYSPAKRSETDGNVAANKDYALAA
jgi:hypothetical protein